GDVAGWGLVSERLSDIRARSGEPSGAAEGSASRRAELEGLEGSAQAALARLQEEQQSRKLRQQSSIDAEGHARRLETTQMTPMTPAGVAGGDAWEQLAPSAAALRIKDLDFSDLLEDEDIDVLDNMDSFDSSSSSCRGFPGIPPPPPPLPGLSAPPPPPPPPAPAFSQQKKKTVKLFWKELKQNDAAPPKCRFGRGTVWASLDKVAVDTSRLEHLFESKAKELVIAKV
ncbi:FH1/FH2 domain-containing protein 1, partial [Perca flavescens]|uniref:FH1/FH2 domain-containing protein 1 n=1 Tax=Perca flavescens TaxID=8167 RepID=UPI00106EC2F1